METADAKVLEFRIPADTRYIAVVRRGIRSLAESAGFSKDAVADVEVAVSEAVANSVAHGSPNPRAAVVSVKCKASNDLLVVEIEDQGAVDSLPSMPPECDPRQETGRGMLMMRALMDECEDCRTETGLRVRMAKQKVG